MNEPTDIDALIEDARERVLAHQDFARYAPTSSRLDGFYAGYARMADALETTATDLARAREVIARITTAVQVDVRSSVQVAGVREILATYDQKETT